MAKKKTKSNGKLPQMEATKILNMQLLEKNEYLEGKNALLEGKLYEYKRTGCNPEYMTKLHRLENSHVRMMNAFSVFKDSEVPSAVELLKFFEVMKIIGVEFKALAPSIDVELTAEENPH